MILATSDTIEGRQIIETIGLVRGNSARTRGIGYDITAGIRNIFGGAVPEYANLITRFDGTKIISGGTSADIVARELGRRITTDLGRFRRSALPPISHMEGIDLVTEGILTLTETLNLLEGKPASSGDSATLLRDHLLDSDVVHILVGTKVNQAHQDPSLPIELEIRRSLMRRIATTLESRYFKEVTLEFI